MQYYSVHQKKALVPLIVGLKFFFRQPVYFRFLDFDQHLVYFFFQNYQVTRELDQPDSVVHL